MMKILVPVDFSENAANVVRYALDWAKHNGGELTLLTVYQIPHLTGRLRNLESVILDTVQDDFAYFLKPFNESLSSDIVIHRVIKEGNTAETIAAYAKANTFDLIMIGLRGSSKYSENRIGSNASKVIQNASTPVLVVPKNDLPFTSWKKSLLCLDTYGISQEATISYLAFLKKEINTILDVLHVSTKGEHVYLEKESGKLTELINTVYDIQEDNVSAGINNFAHENDYDVIIMLKKSHSFLEQLLWLGNVESGLIYAELPVLVLKDKAL